jgi:hypothetical protein
MRGNKMQHFQRRTTEGNFVNDKTISNKLIQLLSRSETAKFEIKIVVELRKHFSGSLYIANKRSPFPTMPHKIMQENTT